MQNFEFRLPEAFTTADFGLSDQTDLPADACFFRAAQDGAEITVNCFGVSEEIAMPFSEESLGAQLKEEISAGEKLLFSKTGTTAGGRPFVCDVLKRRGEAAEAYMLNLNLRAGEEIAYLGAKFSGNCSPESVKQFYEFIISNN